MIQVVLGLGSNIDAQKHLCAGLEALDILLKELHCSPVFESLAVGYQGPNFHNLVVTGYTDSPLLELDRQLKAIEADNGRYAPQRKGLPLDIDVLLYGDQVGTFGGELVLPRAEILRNAFVLWPLALLIPEQQHPVAQQSFAQLWQHSGIQQQLWPIAFQWRAQALTPQWLLEEFPHPNSAL